MKKSLVAGALLMVLLCAGPVRGLCQDYGVSLGYGFAAFNKDNSTGKIQGGKSYSFIQATFLYEKPLSPRELALVVEPFASYVDKPSSGAEGGFDLGLKYYPFQTQKGGLYLTAGPGMAYSSVGFQDQGTNLLFVIQGGIGYRYKNLFIEDRFRNYSNWGTASPNGSINANIITLGTYF